MAKRPPTKAERAALAKVLGLATSATQARKVLTGPVLDRRTLTKRIDDLLVEWSDRLRKRFLGAVEAMASNASVAYIVGRLDEGDIDGALAGVGIAPATYDAMMDEREAAVRAGAAAVGDSIPIKKTAAGVRVEFAFGGRNQRAERILTKTSARKAAELSDDQIKAARQHLTAGMVAGENPREVALSLVGRLNRATGKREGGILGLTAAQEQIQRNYAAELAEGSPKALRRKMRDKRFDGRVLKAIGAKRGLTAAEAEPMIRAYRIRALKLRGDTIARTEALRALHEGEVEAMAQAIEQGHADASAIEKVWNSAGDDRVRDSHAEMDGQRVPYGESFKSPSGAELRYPGDPDAPAAEIINCRCNMTFRINFLARLRPRNGPRT